MAPPSPFQEQWWKEMESPSAAEYIRKIITSTIPTSSSVGALLSKYVTRDDHVLQLKNLLTTVNQNIATSDARMRDHISSNLSSFRGEMYPVVNTYVKEVLTKEPGLRRILQGYTASIETSRTSFFHDMKREQDRVIAATRDELQKLQRDAVKDLLDIRKGSPLVEVLREEVSNPYVPLVYAGVVALGFGLFMSTAGMK